MHKDPAMRRAYRIAFVARQRLKGRCVKCRRKNVDGWRCKWHQEANRRWMRAYYRRKHGVIEEMPKCCRLTRERVELVGRVVEVCINGHERRAS